MKQLTFDLGDYIVRYDLTYESAAEKDYHIAEFQDTTEQTGAYRFRLGFIAKSTNWRFRAVLRVTPSPPSTLPKLWDKGAGVKAQTAPQWEEWTPHKDLLDLIDDGFAITLVRHRKWLHPSGRVRVRVDYLSGDGRDRNVSVMYKLLDYYDRAVERGDFRLVLN